MSPSPHSSTVSPPPPLIPSISPDHAASSPTKSQPTATSDSPTSAKPSPSSSSPSSTAPPPSLPSSLPPSSHSSPTLSFPPPTSPPPLDPNAPSPSAPPPPTATPPSSASPPTSSTTPPLSPPPPASTPPLPSSPPPPTTTPPSSPSPSPPPTITPPVTPPKTTPPPSPAFSPPPQTILPSPPPPSPISTPPPVVPGNVPPPAPVVPSPSPPSMVAQSPPPPSPTTSSTPPPVAKAPPSVVFQSPPPPGSFAPPPPKHQPTQALPPSPSNSTTPASLSTPSSSTSPTKPPPSSTSGGLSGSQGIPPASSSGNDSSSSSLGSTTRSGSGISERGGGLKSGTTIVIAIVASILVVSLVGVGIWYVRKRRRPSGNHIGGYVMPTPITSSQMSDPSNPKSPSPPLVRNSPGSIPGYARSPSEAGLGNSKSLLSYEQLYESTNGFSDMNILGEGGFGCVYKGCLPDGREVAIKKLKFGGTQGEREFKAEVEIISRIHHRHLVSLVGYCIAENQRLLVYDFVPNDTLHHHLHGTPGPVMDWSTRVKVAIGAARGIAYLHEDCHPRIIHRDIKSSNILLDNSFEAQVSDFGLARLALDANTHVTTRVMGTFGYLAPEYASSGKLTYKSDVYSFGVVLLELITGRLPVDSSQPVGDESLVEWARPLLARALDNGDFQNLTDPRLEKNYSEGEMFRMIEIAAACIRHSAAMRPRMGQVARVLESLSMAEMDLNNGIIPGQSEPFVSALRSADIRLFHRMAFGSHDYSSDVSQASWNSRRGNETGSSNP